MPVYFIRSGDAGPVKIGWATKVEFRRQALQISHYEPLCVIRVLEGTKATEQWLQDYFAAQCLRGEWFRFSEDMLAIEPPDLTPLPESKKPRPSRAKGPPLGLVSWASDWVNRSEERRCPKGRVPILPLPEPKIVRGRVLVSWAPNEREAAE